MPFTRSIVVGAVLLASQLHAQTPSGAPQAPPPPAHEVARVSMRTAATRAAAAAAADSTDGGQATRASTSARITSGWRDGFVLESDDGEFRLQFGVLLHADGRVALDDTSQTVSNTFAIRRLRPSLRGRVARRFEFVVNPDFGGGTLVLQDAYVETILNPAVRIRAGKTKTPFGLERLHSASNLLFFERALPTALVPNRDIGVQVLGDVSGGLVSYVAGVMNGVPDGGSADLDTSDAADVSGRLVVRPWRRAATSPLRGLGLAISVSAGKQSGAAALPAFRTQSLQQPYFSYTGTGAVADGTRTRYSPQAWFFYKRFGGWGEYVHTQTAIRSGASAVGDVGHTAWQVAGSWVLTGEPATDAGAGARPRRSFDLGRGGWGAVQLAARYHVLEVDRQAFARGLAAPGSSRTAEAFTLGTNWYLNPNVKYVLNVERTAFDGNADGPRRAEYALVFRTQLAF